jgi:hypothetical protein
MAQKRDDTGAVNAAGRTPAHQAPSGLVEDCSSVCATGAPGAQTEAQLPDGAATQQPPQADKAVAPVSEPAVAPGASATSIEISRPKTRVIRRVGCDMVLRASRS